MSASAIALGGLWSLVQVDVPAQAPPIVATELAATLLAAGTYRAVIDRTYPLDELAEASRYVETGRKVGSVVVVVRP